MTTPLVKPATPLIPVLPGMRPSPHAGAVIEVATFVLPDPPTRPDAPAAAPTTLVAPEPTRPPPGMSLAGQPVQAAAEAAPPLPGKPVAKAAARRGKRANRSEPAATAEPIRRRPVHKVAHGTSTLVSLAAVAAVGMAALGFVELQSGVRAVLSDTNAVAGSAPLPARPVTAASRQPSLPPAPADALPAVLAVPSPSQTAAVPVSGSEAAPAMAVPAAPANPQPPMPAAVAPATAVLATPPATPLATPPVTPLATPLATEPVAAPALMAAEIEHVARFDALIAPVRDTQPSLEDATRLRDAFASTANAAQTRALRDQLKEPAARKLIDWALARGGNASARDIKSFLDTNSTWPSRDTLMQRAEEQLFVSGGSVADIKAFFDKGTPKTGIGHAALASAFLAEGDEAQATRLAALAWRRSDIPANLETGFLERFGRLLTEADHKARFDKYLIDNTRWTNDRTERANVARRMLPFLGEPERKKAEARLAAYLRLPTADALIAALPADAATVPKADWGLAFQLAQWNRRAGRSEATWKILQEAPVSAIEAGNLDEWWEERRVAAYDALKSGKAQIAYDIVKAPGPLGVTAAKDQTFLAGWIALRQLNDPKASELHFAALEAVADGPLSRAKAGYWLARTFEAQGARDKMRAPLERAARNIDTFYGQLARLELDPKQTAIRITPPRMPTAEEAQRFNNNEMVRAAVLSRKSNLDQWVTRALLIRLSQTLETEPEQGLLAHLAEALGDTQMAVRIGKSAIARGYNLMMYGYPIHAMPAYASLRPAPEPALMLGIARQESEFDTSILSGAGARGLMQVMTVTAQHVCRDYRVKCELERLGKDPAYNVMMASAYIGDRMDEFQGSYVLTIAGYNAGPNRARQWVKEFGDPRAANVDPVDWIHRMPFEETREYVQKVLSNTQIYRARLGNEADALRLTSDLRRVAAPMQRRAAATPNVVTPAANN